MHQKPLQRIQQIHNVRQGIKDNRIRMEGSYDPSILFEIIKLGN